ncbi:MAG: VCBS repeat-containing protein, partial [Ginsengibacter sp.]
PDLYVVSGGYSNSTDGSYQDRLYINDHGVFKRKENALPVALISGSCVRPVDIDGDGDIDLFVGGRVVPGQYPRSPENRLLINDGKGNFTNQTAAFSTSLSHIGMVTDALWMDVNHDKKFDLVLCGEWMHLYCFENGGNKLSDMSYKYFDTSITGLWNRLQVADLNGDGHPDIIAGNWGNNSQLHASAAEPVEMYYGDFDENGYVDPLLCYYIEGVSYPMASRDELTDQIVSLRQRFPTYDSYSQATIKDVLSKEQLDTAKKLSANYLNTCWFENKNEKFIKHELPLQANYSPVYAIVTDDFNDDGNMDILLGGNIDHTRIKIGKIDANYGVVLTGDGKGNFTYLNQMLSGLNIKGCVRDFVIIKTNATNKKIISAVNDDKPLELIYK